MRLTQARKYMSVQSIVDLRGWNRTDSQLSAVPFIPGFLYCLPKFPVMFTATSCMGHIHPD